MIFCKSHSNYGQKIVFLDFQICFGQEDSPHGAFWHHVSLRKVCAVMFAQSACSSRKPDLRILPHNNSNVCNKIPKQAKHKKNQAVENL